MSVRVLLADDHAAIREALRVLLESHGIDVVGEAGDGAAAVARAIALRPDVVLMDVRMPGVDGIEATRRIVEAGAADVLMLTSWELDDIVLGALRAGAAGFLLKTADGPTLIDAVRRVGAGEGVLSPEVTRRTIAALLAGPVPAGGDDVDAQRIAALTPREAQVLEALGAGLSNADIAAALSVSATTVKTHVSSVLAKLGVATRMQAAVIARRGGLA